jgi:hypothetical protein
MPRQRIPRRRRARRARRGRPGAASGPPSDSQVVQVVGQDAVANSTYRNIRIVARHRCPGECPRTRSDTIGATVKHSARGASGDGGGDLLGQPAPWPRRARGPAGRVPELAGLRTPSGRRRGAVLSFGGRAVRCRWRGRRVTYRAAAGAASGRPHPRRRRSASGRHLRGLPGRVSPVGPPRPRPRRRARRRRLPERHPVF